MKRFILFTVSGLLISGVSHAQNLTLVAEECTAECPSYDVRDMFEMFKPFLYQAFRDSESGTVNAHEEGGWIVQSREKQADGCYQYCTKLYRASAGQECFYASDSDDPSWCSIQLGAKPTENENTRVVANFHTHPTTLIDIEDILDVNDMLDPTNGNMQFNGYEFPDVEYDNPELEYLGGTSKGDRIGAVEDGVPGIIISGDGSNENISNAGVYGFNEYAKDENGNIVDAKGGLVYEPQSLSWDCEACVDIVPIDECLETGESITFQAEVKGPEDKSVRWEAREGSFSGDGNYQAPPNATTDMIIATSVADENAKDTLSVPVGCDCFWDATLSGDITGTSGGEIAVYLASSQLEMTFLSGPEEGNYPKLAAIYEGPVPQEPTTLNLTAFSYTVNAQGPFLSGGSKLEGQFPVRMVIEHISNGVIEGRIEGTIGGKAKPFDPLDEEIAVSTINMIFRARFYVEGEPYPCEIN